jgi:hypothetical protein
VSPISTRTRTRPGCRSPAPRRPRAPSPGSTAITAGISRRSSPAGPQATVSPTLAGTKDFGSFSGAQLVAGNLNAGGDAAVSDVSCPNAGECAIAGFYTDKNHKQQGFIAVQSATTATSDRYRAPPPLQGW